MHAISSTLRPHRRPGKPLLAWVLPTVALSSLVVLSLMASHPSMAAVRLEGVEEPLRSNILAHMRLDEETCDQTRVRVRYRFDRAPDAIRAALKPFGYYDPVITARLDQPEEGCWQAVFTVEPGEPVLVGSKRIEVQGDGQELPFFQTLLEDTGINEGQRLEHDAYEILKSQLLVVAHEYGFFDARLAESTILVNRQTLQAEVSLVLDTGQRYQFGELSVTGDILDERLLLRYVDFEEGAPFEQRRLRKLHNDLVRGDYFSSVDVQVIPGENQVADVVLTLEEGRRLRYGVGVGFGTDTGLVVSGDMVQRRLNRLGHRLELDAELSRVRQNATVDYRIPGKRQRLVLPLRWAQSGRYGCHREHLLENGCPGKSVPFHQLEFHPVYRARG